MTTSHSSTTATYGRGIARPWEIVSNRSTRKPKTRSTPTATAMRKRRYVPVGRAREPGTTVKAKWGFHPGRPATIPAPGHWQRPCRGVSSIQRMRRWCTVPFSRVPRRRTGHPIGNSRVRLLHPDAIALRHRGESVPLVEPDVFVELVGQGGLEIVARPLGLRSVHGADRALEPGSAQCVTNLGVRGIT